MTRALSGVGKHARTLMAIVLLAGWTAVVGAEEFGGTALYLHPDAYWYNNENHTPSTPAASTPSVELASRPR